MAVLARWVAESGQPTMTFATADASGLPHARTVLITGFCGGYTTFSAFSLETAGLFEGGEYTRAAAYILLSMTLSIAATFAGIAAARAAA